MKDKRLYEVIYFDESIIVVNKPANVLTIPDRFDKSLPNLRALLEEKFGRVWVVHRLDKETSGVVLFARDAESHKILNQQFENQDVQKIYHAVVSGWLPKDELEIDIPLATDPSNKWKTVPSARGKDALTIVRVLERYSIATLIECNLVTGRHHQIRVHCSTIGNPLIVDEIYGKNNSFFVSTLKRRFNLKKGEEEKPIISRLSLHSFSITFKHPTSGDEVSYFAPYPKDFSALIKVLRKYGKIL
ncbi:MAG: RluA family pseudouridine synthase [Ignavibacteria bacterium]|nr:RluA family pseudouridine synthase [Ignavibacteria bacterium]